MHIFQQQGVEWFYFEGSMLKNVEAYISGFRAEPVLYFGYYPEPDPFFGQGIDTGLQKMVAGN